jgi:dTDP-glucose 4,6-dehydratase
MTNPLARDLDHVLEHARGAWDELRGARIFVTGGTGFFGCWLLESFAWACDSLNLDASMTVLTRSPEAFHKKAPHLAAHPAIQLLQGDICSFHFPGGRFSHVIHAATEAYPQDCRERPLFILDTIVDGARRVLDFAAAAGARRFLLTSSGAVYGPQPAGIAHIPETYRGSPAPSDERAVYSEGKRMSELLCALYHREHGLECVIARGFAFVGAYMPFGHYAIGNFILDQMRGGPIQVKGDGAPVRSYLYAADLAVWLWTILVKGQPCRPYNVGSEQALSIAEVAAAVSAALHPRAPVVFAQPPAANLSAGLYIPSTGRARGELGLRQLTPLDEAIRRTAAAAPGYGR